MDESSLEFLLQNQWLSKVEPAECVLFDGMGELAFKVLDLLGQSDSNERRLQMEEVVQG